MYDRNELVGRDQGQVAPFSEQTRPEPSLIPAVDIYENKDDLVLFADMPGVEKKDLNIKLEDRLLTIEGLVREEKDEKERSLLTEYQVARYFRTFTLGDAVDRGKIQAKLVNGVLHLVLPKSEAAKPHKIEVCAAE